MPKLNWKIKQGVHFNLSLAWNAGTEEENNPVDLTGCTAVLQARSDFADFENVLYFELSTANEKIEINPLTGTLIVKVSPEDTLTEAWKKGNGRGVWDLEITFPGGQIFRLFEGSIILSREVTRG